MRLLFIHQNLPGQFRHLLSYYMQRKDVEIFGIGERRWVKENLPNIPAGCKVLVYDLPETKRGSTHPYLWSTDSAVERGQAVVRLLHMLKAQGFVPDVVYAHPGWGESLFVKDVFPTCRLIHYCEFFYRAAGQDVGFDPEYPSSFDEILGLRVRNATHLLSLDAMDAGISPTHWQLQCFPEPYQKKIHVIHDGIDTKKVRPDSSAALQLPTGRILTAADEVVTFVNRNLEPSRGFHIFMRALPELLAARPNAQVVIIGGDGVSYGKPSNFGSYRLQMLNELGKNLPLERIHFLGQISYEKYLKALQISSAHVYLTYPFVLSWSLLEAMAAGCLVIGSDTPPVREIIEDKKNGLLVDFFSPAKISRLINEVFMKPSGTKSLRLSARETVVEKYDLIKKCLPHQIEILNFK
ncbi:glycosyltransferase family 4 protein [Ralstonia pseudosolanacearum]|uniref:Glycosyltransferase n=1 Tax=Ralstonia solanacearum TaxID=305 RepID=A0AA92IFH7_RALSL|nr:glycosyltransferase family 4 protein [Ralstonia pseudosolanacearum]QCX51077.1 glycosyltransferase [Ralstonia pseudosolanacearum]